jgi:hypothetical protein
MHDASMRLMKMFRDEYLKDMKGCTILDIGSRVVDSGLQKSYKDLLGEDFKYTGMDVEPGENVDIVGFDNLKGKVFDVVVSGQTMEHVNHPWDWLKSLKPYYSKYLCIIAPHKIHEHRYPIDTYRYLPDGMRDLFNYAKINVVEIKKGRVDTMGIGSK